MGIGGIRPLRNPRSGATGSVYGVIRRQVPPGRPSTGSKTRVQEKPGRPFCLLHQALNWKPCPKGRGRPQVPGAGTSPWRCLAHAYLAVNRCAPPGEKGAPHARLIPLTVDTLPLRYGAPPLRRLPSCSCRTSPPADPTLPVVLERITRPANQ